MEPPATPVRPPVKLKKCAVDTVVWDRDLPGKASGSTLQGARSGVSRRAGSALAFDHTRVTECHHSLRATPTMANQAVDILSRNWNAVEDRGPAPKASSPCRLLMKYRERRRERFISDEEFCRLGRMLAEAETRKGVSVDAIAAIRLLLPTGCWRNENPTLRWQDLDLEARELKSADSKTGARTVLISQEAADVLATIPASRVAPGSLAGTSRAGPCAT